MEDPAAALETLTRLKRLNVELTIDDFGTGYSSLAYLQRLPVDTIKIDQSFVRDMVTNENSATIVRYRTLLDDFLFPASRRSRVSLGSNGLARRLP